MTLQVIFDLLLVTAMLLVAWRAIHAPTLFGAVVLYVAFGLLLSLIWVRLEAPDLALAEAAIGAGITGAILLDAAGQMGSGPAWRLRLPQLGALSTLAACGGVALLFGFAFVSLAEPRPGLREAALNQLPGSGVEHPITAVLLNYRGYDTWLEVAVLLAAAVGLLGLHRGGGFTALPRTATPHFRLEAVVASRLAVFGVLMAGYLLWRGSHAPGGAFQAGAVLGAGAILLRMSGLGPLGRISPVVLRLLLVAGFLVFLLVGCATLLTGGALLEFGHAFAGPAILLLELAVAVSVAATVVLLFAGATPPAVNDEGRAS